MEEEDFEKGTIYDPGDFGQKLKIFWSLWPKAFVVFTIYLVPWTIGDLLDILSGCPRILVHPSTNDGC